MFARLSIRAAVAFIIPFWGAIYVDAWGSVIASQSQRHNTGMRPRLSAEYPYRHTREALLSGSNPNRLNSRTLMKYFLLAAFWLVAASSSLAAPTQQIVTLETGSGELEGTLLTADSADSKTVALIIAGSGPTDRDGNNPAMTNNSLKCWPMSFQRSGFRH